MTDRVGQQLGNYRLIRLLGRGGFAEVYLGEHVRLGTNAAIKVLQTQLASQEVENFQHEAQTIAHLEHAHIVRVLDFDVVDGTPFLVMSHAPNGTLRSLHPKDISLPLPMIIYYLKQIADALQYAHDEKVIHRDIKPENMLVGRRNEILLSDFGIAMMVQSSRYQSTQNMVGTVTYMAPEQIQGKPRPASDQYALGVVVYEWLSGNRPFQGSFTEIATQHVLAPPPPLHEKISTISLSIEHVVMTALEKDPHKRFASVRAFANALEQASQEEKGPSTMLPVKIQPSPANASSVLERLSDNVPTEASLPPTLTVIPPAMNIPRIGTLLRTYHGHSGSVSSVIWSPVSIHIASASDDGTVHIWTANTGSLSMTYCGHSKEVSSAAWSPDSSRIVSAGADQTVQIWEATTGHHLFTYRGHASGVWSVAWSPDGTYVASASDDQTVHVWDEATGELVFICYGQVDSIWTVAWSPDDKYLAFESDKKVIQVCDSIDGRKVRTYRGHTDRVWSIAWSPDGTSIASGGEDGTVQIWTVAKGRKILTYRGHSESVIAVAWSPDGVYIASASEDQTVQVWIAP